MIGLMLTVSAPMMAAEAKPGTQTAQELKVKVGDKETTLEYWLFLPKSYDQKKSWPLMLLARNIVRHRRWPEILTCHLVIALYKKKSVYDARNYRESI